MGDRLRDRLGRELTLPDGLNVDGDVLWIEGIPFFCLDDAEQLDPVVMDLIAGGLPDVDVAWPQDGNGAEH